MFMLPPPQQRLLNILKFITCIIIVIVTISIPISCRKIDFSTDKVLAIERNKFFSLPAGVPPVLERIVNDMKRQDAIKPFVHNFIRNVGYPAWQHVKINISRPAYQSAEPESDTLVTVPIVKEGVGYLSGVLAIKVNSEVWYKLLEGIKYYELPIEESGTSTEEIFTVLDFFKMMMSLEYEMFGQNEFVITDEELLNRLSAQIYLSGEPEISYDYGTQLSFSNGCTIFNYGYYTSSGFTITSTEALCLYEPAGLVYMLTVPETGGGGPTGGTGSGTPGTTNTDDEECKRGFVGVIEFDEEGMPIVPCEILESGDTPTYPCAKADSLAQKMTALIQDHAVDSALHSILPDIATQPNEKGFPVFRHFAVNPNNVHDTTLGAYSVGPMFIGNNSDIVMNYAIPYLSFEVATLHTHPSDSYSAPSAKDIYKLISKKLEADNFLGTFVVAADSSQYALTITDYNKARSFFYTQDQFLDGDKWNENSEIGKEFKDVYDYFTTKVLKNNTNKNSLSYEMAMAAVLNQLNSGVTLNKKDSLGIFRPLVVKTTTPKANKPNKKVYTQDCL